jgi:hypothetical protein
MALGGILLSAFVWNGAYAIHWSLVGLDDKIFWMKIMYFGVLGIPTLFLIFILEITHHEDWLTARNFVLLGIQPLAMIVTVWSDFRLVFNRIDRLWSADLVDEPWFATGSGRVEHVEEIDAAVAAWIGERTRADVLEAFERAEAAAAPIYDAEDILSDPHFAARGTVASVDDADVGTLRLPSLLARLSETPGEIRWSGREHGADTADVLDEIGVDAKRLERLRAEGVV